jgi:hypothetical protein
VASACINSFGSSIASFGNLGSFGYVVSLGALETLLACLHDVSAALAAISLMIIEGLCGHLPSVTS